MKIHVFCIAAAFTVGTNAANAQKTADLVNRSALAHKP